MAQLGRASIDLSTRHADRDALWRPGYTGSYGVPTSANTTRRRRRWWRVTSVAVVLALGTSAVRLTVGREAATTATGVASTHVPVTVDERWSVAVTDVGAVDVVGSRRLILLHDGRGQQLVALDAATGAQRWRHRDDVAGVAIVGDVIVGVTRAKGSARAVVGLATGTGDVQWTRRLNLDDRVEIDGPTVLVMTGQEGGRRLQRLDPTTGRTAASIDGDEITLTRDQVQAREGSSITVFDRATFDQLGSVDLAALGIDPSGVAVAVGASGLIVAAPTSLDLVGADGAISDRLPLHRSVGDLSAGLDVLDAAGQYVALQRGGRLTIASTGDGSLRELWSLPAWLIDWHVDADRRLVAMATRSGSIVALPPQVVDLTTGQRAWPGPAAVQQSSPMHVFAADGFIAVQRSAGIDAPVVVGYDLDRVSQWRRGIDRDATPYLTDGGLVTVEPGPGTSNVVTLFA